MYTSTNVQLFSPISPPSYVNALHWLNRQLLVSIYVAFRCKQIFLCSSFLILKHFFIAIDVADFFCF